MSPRVSVIMPAYQDLRFLDGAVGSVLRQTFPDFELIIVDDGDGRVGEFARQSARDPRIRVIASRANEGNPAAANRGIALARGEIIARLDADDVMLPDLVAAQVAALDADPALGVVGTGYATIDEKGRQQQSHRRPESDFEIRWTCLFANPFLHSTVAFRRSCYDAAGGYDGRRRVSADYEFWLRLLAHCRGANLPQQLLHYRENSRGLTAIHRDGWHHRNDPLRQRAWEAIGVAYNSRLADQLARFALGEEIANHALRAAACRTGLTLLRRLAEQAGAADRAVVGNILRRMRDDELVDLHAAVDAGDLAWAEALVSSS